MNKRKLWKLIAVLGLTVTSLLFVFLLLGQITVWAASGGMDCPAGGSSLCDTLTDPMELCLCHFVTGIYPDGLLTNWSNPRLPGHIDHAPMRDYAEPPDQQALSESASMLALYAALIGDQTTFDDLFEVSAPAEIGGTGAPMSSTQESPYYFASPNLCLLHWILDENGYKEDSGTDWLANAAGEESRWLEALSIADQKFPAPKYRLLANCLAQGLIGVTDFNADAIGNFEDPDTSETFDDYLLRPYFGWQDDFSHFATTTSTNLSYNNLMGWRYVAQLGQEPHAIYQTADGVGGTETITIPLQAVGSIRIDMTQRGSDWGYSLYEVEAYNPFTDTNLLLDAECTASSYQNDMFCSDCTCDKALDGNLSTRWSSDQPAYPGGPLAPQWLVITPTHSSRVMTITLHWELAHASSYSLTASWPFADFYSNVLSHTAPLMAGSIQHCGTDLPRVMYDVERHFYYGEILTPNLVCTTDVTATASSTQDPALSPGNAADCDPTTRWSSNWNDDEWIAIEFSEPVTIDGAILKWETAYGEAYTIDVSDDGVTWTSVYTETSGNGDDDEIHFPLTTTRHIRMHGLSRGTLWGYSLWEFEVYRGGTSSWTALDLARRAAAYAKVSGDTALWEMGRRILDWYKAEYPSSIAAAYDPCTGDPLPGWNWHCPSIMADLAELAAEYCDCSFASQVIEENLRPELITDPDDPLACSVGPSAFENLEVLLALRHVDECCSAADVAIVKSSRPPTLTAGAWLTYTLVYSNNGPCQATNVVITDVVPITLTNVSTTSSGAQITPTGSVSYTWQVEDLSPGEGGVITITAQVSPSVSGLFTLTNQATITTTDVCYTDENLDNNASVVHNIVDAEPPIAPTLVSPTDGAVINDTTPALTWQASPSPDVAGYLLDWNGTVMDVDNVTQYTTTVLVDDVYTWTVAAYDALGNSSPYTDVWSFEVDANLVVTKQAEPDPACTGVLLTYTIRVTNTGSVDLRATVTDTLPPQVTPTGVLTWAPTITAPGGVWTERFTVTVERGHCKPLINVVQVTTEEGATGVYTETSVVEYCIYLPVILKYSDG